MSTRQVGDARDFGHGFLPRIDKRNWTGVDRALGPAGRLPLGDGIELQWAVVDHAYARSRPSMPEALAAHDVRMIVDSSAWRYREPTTFAVDAMVAAPYAPTEPIVERGEAFRRFVESDLRSQCEVGAAAFNTRHVEHQSAALARRLARSPAA